MYRSKYKLSSAAKISWLFFAYKTDLENLLCFFLTLSALSNIVGLLVTSLLPSPAMRKPKGTWSVTRNCLFVSQTASIHGNKSWLPSPSFCRWHSIDFYYFLHGICWRARISVKRRTCMFMYLRSGRWDYCNIDCEDYATLVFKSRWCLCYG